MKIKVIFGAHSGSYPPAEIEMRKKRLLQYASKGVDIDFGFLDQGTVYTESIESDNYDRIAQSFFKKAVEAESEGCDAITLYGTLDPGIEHARKLVKVPVISWGIATYSLALLLAKKIGVIVYEDSYLSFTRKMAEQHHVAHLVVSLRSVGIPLSQMAQRRSELREKLIDVGRDAVSRGAEVIYPQGVSMIPLHYSPEEIEREVGVPVLNAMKIGIKVTELLASIHSNITNTKRGWQ